MCAQRSGPRRYRQGGPDGRLLGWLLGALGAPRRFGWPPDEVTKQRGRSSSARQADNAAHLAQRERQRLTAIESERISYRTVSRLKPLVAFLLLAVWGPSEISWALALVAVADGSHHVSLRSSHGDLDLVLHHHSIPSGTDDDVLDADDHPHGDHVIYGPGTDRVLAASRLAQGDPPSQLCVQGDVSSPGVACDRSLLRVATPSAIGPSPPLRTVVLRI